MLEAKDNTQDLPTDITAIILTYNEEKHIERCILSIKDLAKKIVIIDSLSDDNTLNIVKQHNIDVLQNKFVNHAKQINWALKNANINTKWILRFDADEVLTEKLAKKIHGNLKNLPPNVAGVSINLKLFFFGKNINLGGVYPQKRLRIWKNGSGKCSDDWVDEHINVEGDIVHFDEDIIDNNLKNIAWWTEKHNKYSTKEAINFILNEQKIKKENFSKTNRETKLNKFSKFGLYYKLPSGIRPFLLFIYRYFFLLGFLNGWQGLVFHSLQGFWFRFLVDVKIKELIKIMNNNNLTLAQAVKSQYNYDL